VDPVSAAQQEHGVDKSAPTAASIEFLGLTLEGRCADRIAALKKLHDVNKLQWATPHGAKGTTFDLLVHSVNDIVSSNLINSGGWEGDHLHAAEQWHLAKGLAIKNKRYLDIGANIGYFTLLAASRGYEVTSFEAMKKNAAMLSVSLCANPELEKLVTLNVVGLADEKKTCIIVSGDINVADGILRCDLPNAEAWEGYHVRETVELDTMNRLVHGDYFMMKIDIEGSEPLALGSSGSDKYFAKHHIEYLLTESTDSAARLEYFQRLATLGYSLRMIDYGLQRGADDAMAMLGGGTLPDPFDKSKQARAEIQQVNAPDFFGERVDPVSAAL